MARYLENRLSLSSEVEIFVQKEESIKKSLKKHVLVFLVVIFLCIPLFSSQIAEFRLSNYERESIPYADSFLKLLIGREYEELYNKYAIDSGMEIGDLERQANKIDSEFGMIKSFSYKRMSFSMDGMFGDLTGFFYTTIYNLMMKRVIQGLFPLI